MSYKNMTAGTSFCQMSSVSTPVFSVQRICVKTNKCFLLCVLVTFVFIDRNVATSLVSDEVCCFCVCFPRVDKHTEMHDNDRIRPRVLGAVQSTGAGRQRTEKNEWILLHQTSCFILQRHKPNCAGWTDLRFTYVHLLPDQGDPRQAFGGPHLTLFPPLSSWGRQPLGSNYALWKGDGATN